MRSEWHSRKEKCKLQLLLTNVQHKIKAAVYYEFLSNVVEILHPIPGYKVIKIKPTLVHNTASGMSSAVLVSNNN